MEQFDYIINPTTGKKVKITSTIGKKILESYKNLSQYGSGMDLEPEKYNILEEYDNDMREMGRIFSDNIRWLLPPFDLVFFEGDKVIVDIRKLSDLSQGYSNAVGTIINPENINNRRVYDNYFPDIKSEQYQSSDTYQFLYTPSFGHAITELNSGTHNRNQAFLDYVRDDLRLNLYLQMIEGIEEQEEESTPEYNKSTSNPYDVSFRFVDSEKNMRKYLVEWDEQDAEGNNKLSIFNAEELILLSNKDELNEYIASLSEVTRDSESEDEDEGELDIEEDRVGPEDRPFSIGAYADHEEKPPSIMLQRISRTQYNLGLTRMSPERFYELAQQELQFDDDTYQDLTGQARDWMDDTYEMLIDLDEALDSGNNSIINDLMHDFALSLKDVIEVFETNDNDPPVDHESIRNNIDDIDIESLIERYNQGAEYPEETIDEFAHSVSEESVDEHDDDQAEDPHEDDDELSELEERLNALRRTEESESESESEDEESHSHRTMRLRLSFILYQFKMLGLTTMESDNLNEQAYQTLLRLQEESEFVPGSYGYQWIDDTHDIVQNIIYNSSLIDSPNRLQEANQFLRYFADQMSFLMSLIYNESQDTTLININSKIDEIGIEELMRRINDDGPG